MALEVILNSECDEILIGGNYNLPQVNWINYKDGVVVNQLVSHQAWTIFEYFAFPNLFQLNNIFNAYLLALFCPQFYHNVIYAEVPFMQLTGYEYYKIE